MSLSLDSLLNDFAIRSFRDIADADYIAARMACRAALVTQYLWASQQMVEKYLKCILILNRIEAKVGKDGKRKYLKHDLGNAIIAINDSRKLKLDLTSNTNRFIEDLDTCGKDRYLVISNVGFRGDIIRMDGAAWELRRYCTLSPLPLQAKHRSGFPAPKVRLEGGYLEQVIDSPQHPAREPLLWQNAFFGRRVRKSVRLPGGFQATNSPLFLHPEILDDVLKYVYLPDKVVSAYRSLRKP